MISRITDIDKTTILALFLTVGLKCARLFDAKVRNVRPRYIQADEAWAFVQKKQKRLKVNDPASDHVWPVQELPTAAAKMVAVFPYAVGINRAETQHLGLRLKRCPFVL